MKVLIAGDFYPQLRAQASLENNDYSFLDEIKPFTAQVDYSIVNFESCVADKNTDVPIEKIGPNLCSGKNSLQAIRYAGFDCITLANNHFRDYGDGGVCKTLMACEELGIDYVGGGKTLHDAQSILYKQFDDGILAVINVCETEFSIASDHQGGSAPLNPILNYYTIQEAKSKADYILVVVHGGIEIYAYPTPRMKETYRFFVDAGADAVVNHHQHRISGFEVYKGKPIFYGLGNFCFDLDTTSFRSWEKGYLVVVDFNSQSSDYQMIPYIQFADEPKVKFDVFQEDFLTEIDSINEIIQDDRLLNQKLTEFALKKRKLAFFEPYNTRITKGLFSHHLLPSFLSRDRIKSLRHFLRCESHYDVLMAALINAK